MTKNTKHNPMPRDAKAGHERDVSFVVNIGIVFATEIAIKRAVKKVAIARNGFAERGSSDGLAVMLAAIIAPNV